MAKKTSEKKALKKRIKLVEAALSAVEDGSLRLAKLGISRGEAAEHLLRVFISSPHGH